MTVQMDLFLPNDEESLNTRKIIEVEEYITRSNRAQFRRIAELEKKVIEQEARMDRLARGMVKVHNNEY